SHDGVATRNATLTTLGWRFDHPAISVDRSAGMRKDWIYITSHLEWSDGTDQRKSAVFVARSRDGGRRFDVPTMLAPNTSHNISEMPVVLSNGTLIVAFVERPWTSPFPASRRAWTSQSVDGAVSLSAPRLINEECGPPPPFQLSSLATDLSHGKFRDRLYFACRKSGGGPVVVAAS